MSRKPMKVLKTGLILVASAFATAGPGAASETLKPEENAAKSFETILQKASEQGFITIGHDNQNDKSREIKKTKSVTNDPESLTKTVINEPCSDSSVLNFTVYKSVNHYDDIAASKTQIKKVDQLDDVLSVAKTYMSLGLGEEAVSLVEAFNTTDAKALQSLGRTIAGYPDSADKQRLNAYARCHANAKFWALMSDITYDPVSSQSERSSITSDQLTELKNLPVHLQKLMTLRTGLYFAETGDLKTAETFLNKIVPKDQYANPENLSDDSELYFIALVQRGDNEQLSNRILEHLAQYDGLYQSRALQKLAERKRASTDKPYAHFDDDLKSVSQQYSGRIESRRAALQVINTHLFNERYISAIDLAKQQMDDEGAERAEAVTKIGDRILSGLGMEAVSTRLYALNGYLYAPEFLSEYTLLANLKEAAVLAAIELNIPELSKTIITGNEVLSDELQKKNLYAQAQSAMKNGEYNVLKQITKTATSDPFFNALLVKSALVSEHKEGGERALSTVPETYARLKDQASLALQTQKWSAAKMALETLAQDAPDEALTNKIHIADYLSLKAPSDEAVKIPASVEAMDSLAEQLAQDITLVKVYLDNG